MIQTFVDINIVALIMIAIGTVAVFLWLWVGSECNHMYYCAGPLASAGYSAIPDNLFKCYLLFMWILYCLIGQYIAPLGTITMFAILMVLAVYRQITGWIS